MPLSKIRTAEQNPKRHAEREIQDSLAEFGAVESMTLDERTGRLVAGHGRFESYIGLRERGEPPPEGVLVDPETGEWLVPVERGWASRTDRHAETYLLVSNRLVEAGGWDKRALAAMLDDLTAWDPAVLDRLAMSEDDMDELLAAFREQTDPDTAPIDDPVDDEPADLTADPEGDGDGSKTVQCPSCGHRFENRV